MTIYGCDFWEIIKPAATTNLIQNPSVETNTTGWAAASGAAIAQTTASQFFGIYGLQVTPTSASSDGVYFGGDSIPFGTVSSSTYTFSTYFKGQSGVPYEIYFASTAGAMQGTSTSWLATGDWERQEITYTESSTASRRAYVVKKNSADTGVFIVDGAQVEVATAATTYCDGGQLGCIWLADPHGSKSWRDGDSKAGGEIINLDEDYDIIVRQQPGAGMPPLQNIQTDLGIQDGGLFQRTKVQPRTLTLSGVVTGSDVNDFHYNRQRLLDLFKPDQGAPQGPFLIRYNSGSAITKQLKAHYDSGFEMTEITARQEFFSVRLIAYDPYWEEIKDNAQELDTFSSLGSGDLFTRDIDNSGGTEGAWRNLGSQSAGKQVLGPDGKIYFPVLSGVSTVKRYNPQTRGVETFLPTAAGSGFSGGAAFVFDMDFDSAGNLYIGGNFLTAGSISACSIVKWDGNDFSQIAGNDGFDDNVLTVTVDRKTNTLYVGGFFDNSGSVTACRIASLSLTGGTEFSQVGDGVGGSDPVHSFTAGVYSIEPEISGSNLYISGCFTESGSIGVCGIAYFNGNEFENLGNACINGGVYYGLVVKQDDSILFGGNFTGTFQDSAGSPSYFTGWDGTDFTIGSDFSPTASIGGMSYDDSSGETLVSLGAPNAIPNISNAGAVAIWNGTTWLYSDIFIDVAATFNFNKNGAAMVKTGTVTPDKGSVATVTNGGTAAVFPELVFNLPAGTASDVLYFANNVSASKSMQFNYTLLEAETVTLSPGDGTAISDIRGNVIGGIVPGSNFSTWYLLPGDNIIVPFAESDNTDLFIKWKNRHWSIDGGHA